MESIDELIYQAILSPDETEQLAARGKIRALAAEKHVLPSSTCKLYEAFAKGIVTGFTVPAINLRTLTYDMARLVFQLMKKHDMALCIFEIARSEMIYSDQTYDDIVLCVLAAAIKESYTGPVFIQADHLQVSRRRFLENPEEEIHELKELITDAIAASVYNIDIDASTLVDLTESDIMKQQVMNAKITAELTTFTRSLETNVPITIGGEIGHIGDRNSTAFDFTAFMDQYLLQVQTRGMSKVSVQTGTSHGGTVLADGTVEKPAIDFGVLSAVSDLGQKKYHMAGSVQHGASTVPLDLFSSFPKHKTVEIHLSTGFQNTLFETMPEELKKTIYLWLETHAIDERNPAWTDEQFYYKTRKKALGKFKKELWTLRDEEKQPILDELTRQLEKIFEPLGMFGTKKVIEPFL